MKEPKAIRLSAPGQTDISLLPVCRGTALEVLELCCEGCDRLAVISSADLMRMAAAPSRERSSRRHHLVPDGFSQLMLRTASIGA